jgi:hypothetical protein
MAPWMISGGTVVWVYATAVVWVIAMPEDPHRAIVNAAYAAVSATIVTRVLSGGSGPQR